MDSSTGRIHASGVTAGLLLAAIISLLALASASDTAYAATFSPTASTAIGTPEAGAECFDDTDDDGDGKVNDGCPVDAILTFETGAQCDNNTDDDGDTLINEGCPTVGDTSADAAAGITTRFAVSAPDANFGGLVGFTPAGFVRDVGAGVPVGAIVGNLSSKVVLGLINNACDNKLGVDFTFMNATTAGPPFIDPRAPGESDPLRPLLDDNDGDGLPDGVNKYPSYMNLLLDPDYDGPGSDGIPGTADDINGPLPPLTPKARYTGITFITAASTTVVLSFVAFEPGTTFATDPPTTTDPSLGFPSVTILQDPSAPPDPSAITDFCSPLASQTVLLGATQDNPGTSGVNEGGIPFRVNPADGAYNFVNYAVSLRDADGDGHENGLDPCPFTNDSGWDPRQAITSPSYAGDDDFDGIPNSCDEPIPGELNFPSDVDQDGFLNRGDNCPLVTNGKEQLEIAGVGVQLDTDSDGIGDACDTVGAGGIGKGPDVADGDQTKLCVVTVVNVGSGGTPPSTAVPPCADAIIVDSDTTDGGGGGGGGGDTDTDSDGDGVMDADDQCPDTPAGVSVDEVGCTAQQAQEDADGDGVKNIDDECPNTPEGESVDDKGCSASQIQVLEEVTDPTGGGVGGPDTGVGSLAPAIASIPAWAAIASALGGAGLLGSLGALFARIWRRRR